MTETIALSNLRELLDKNRRQFDIEFSGYMSNHMSHVLIALYRLNAPADVLRSYFDDASRHLEPRKPPETHVDEANWQQYIGRLRDYSALVDFFTQQVEQRGVDGALNAFYPRLSGGVSGRAFHGVIELGYALELHPPDPANAAEGLAYLTYGYHSLGPLKTNAPDAWSCQPPLRLLEAVRHDAAFDAIKPTPNGRFQDRMKLLGEEKFQRVLERYDIYLQPPSADTKITVEDQLVKLFAHTVTSVFALSGCRDFFLLHGITSFRALSLVLPCLTRIGDVIEALRSFWRGAVCLYIAQGRPELQPAVEQPQPQRTWAELIETVTAGDDEHLIKLVWVLSQWEAHYGPEPLYLHTAANAVRLVHAHGYQSGQLPL
eukprot:TRINITY_DN30797_c0_g1_i1.p2 TRINITY_DN30797_c0_g1~~TRINITY_DN30797_c0_g1_i1.p2  ORF type:complete len:374 (+),score=164.19 TRINITY_DN30797_c0_g1_i1:77-1198(+)